MKSLSLEGRDEVIFVCLFVLNFILFIFLHSRFLLVFDLTENED